ncbi:hypothetical protein POTOM_041529 [Populus tomentosa]|uniref:non-specific serine/threonine protein kinase n=1 Tax=Populus tomentosa TaxID=118781 RepID=A0A8X7YRA9_POPTO|nr:hypothetical protein POTOM_041529 [Populus tomentosa]
MARRKRNKIHNLFLQNGNWCKEDKILQGEALHYFKDLFCSNVSVRNVDLGLDALPMILDEGKARLICIVFKEEIITNSYRSDSNDHLSVWELKDNETRGFSLVHVISFDNMFSKEAWVRDFVKSENRVIARALAFHPENKDVLYLGFLYHLISCNIRTGELEVIDGIPTFIQTSLVCKIIVSINTYLTFSSSSFYPTSPASLMDSSAATVAGINVKVDAMGGGICALPLSSGSVAADVTATASPPSATPPASPSQELAVTTDSFNPSCSVGEGGFGKHVGVKQLDSNGRQGNKKFFSEIITLSIVQHSNLVKLIGYCVEDDQRLVVYEFMPNESLETHLLALSPERKPLDWTTRMKIASGAAKGLEYLHDTADPQIIYRDFKASNILLDECFHPKLFDFGLAMLGPTEGKDHVSTRVMGTYGYCAPEYQRAGPLVKDRIQFTKMADPLLEGNYPQKCLYQAVAIAAMCLQEEADTRPLMADVVTALEFLATPLEEKKPTVISTENIHYVDSVTGGNVKEE